MLAVMRCLSVCLLSLALGLPLAAQSKSEPGDKFRQLEEILPTPNEYRAASGAPGHRYWQQRADYSIDVELDDAGQTLTGRETITYYNNSPDALSYLWLQLDQNIFDKASEANTSRAAPAFTLPEGEGQAVQEISFQTIDRILAAGVFEGGHRITAVRDAKGSPLRYTVVRTMMRVDLPQPLQPGQNTSFSVEWNYKISDARRLGGRTGYEFFPRDGNYIYEIAQWFPRLAAYHDVVGWQHKQFLGAGEFTLEFGNYRVRITVPDDHTVASTGVLQNPQEVLTPAQRQRLKQAETAKEPMFIITPQEAKANESSKPKGKKTWVFHADNVRDFAFASSRKFIWDAAGQPVGGNRVLAMSYYPNEAEPLWSKYSTHAVMHTLRVYSRHTFDYPYPVAISVNGPVGGMEYPMICFNGPRPLPDGTYPASTKYALITVVMHEVGHNYFPMIVNSDERQWTWMDEGMNTFLQFLAEQEWETGYPSGRGEPKSISHYMASENQVPVMTNSESLLQFGSNAYAKPAAALNVLRESVLGRELFDFAFREYARRWKFKRPSPADFFRTMEDASGVDLDWFWRGWFYTTDHVDISIENVRLYRVDTRDPEVEKAARRREREAEPRTLSQERNAALPKRVDEFPTLKDFYNTYDELVVTERDREEYQKFLAGLSEGERKLLREGLNFYVVELRNRGGVVMPVTFGIEYADGTKEELRLPAEIWRYNATQVSKMVVTRKEISSITLDPYLETADTDLSNNSFPRGPVRTRFRFSTERPPRPNPMQLERRTTETPPNSP